MAHEDVETLIIGAGQAGLATGYHLAAGRPGVPDRRRRGTGRRRLASAVGHPAALQPRPVRRAAGHAVPRARMVLPREGRGGRLLRVVRRAVRPPGPARPACGPPRGRRRSAISPRSVTARSRRTTSSSPPGPSGGPRTCRTSPTASTRSIMQLHSSEYRRPSQLPRRPRPGGRGLALRHRHRLRGRRERTRPSCAGGTPARSRCASSTPMFRVVFPLVVFMFSHVLSRRTPMGRKEMDEFRFHGGLPSG